MKFQVIYAAALDSLNTGAPGLRPVIRQAIARSIALKLAPEPPYEHGVVTGRITVNVPNHEEKDR